ncbi:2,3-dehydroadipyl-CoA hydratase [mine drainage metagenome]|uniref:2,3-dehydroadipyl-CoA hydratase n=1 Tax=mine drainage metagenome TaxID=410659 RepID=A0A1J5Q7E6_9ZZZZ
MDAGPVWASARFPMRSATKASIYRHEVTQAAAETVLLAVERFAGGSFVPQRPACSQWQALMKQAQRAIDWQCDDTATVLRKIRAADGFPGVADALFGQPCHVFDAWPETQLRGAPGELLARRETALLRATRDGAVWIGHVKRPGSIKLPATLAFAAEARSLPQTPWPDWWRAKAATWQDIFYEEAASVGYLHFEFYNGAMSTQQCQRLRSALAWAKQRPTQVLVLMGGLDFWSNGIHLNVIEAASLSGGSAADESWYNITAMNDLALELITTDRQITVAAVGGNTGAGGCFLALAADRVWLREAVMLNPHYKNMGNLYGSEYWTYLLPRRVGADAARTIMQQRQALAAQQAQHAGLADDCLPGDVSGFRRKVISYASKLAVSLDIKAQLTIKNEARSTHETAKPLAQYRQEEMAQMQRNFYGFDPSYHVARHHFVHKSPASWTPRHLCVHRDLHWSPP